MKRLLLSSLLLLLSGSTAHSATIAGRASVIDGDTLEIHGERIRILDIDAPESKQLCIRPDGAEWRCGQQAAIELADWIGARPVTCETSKRDRYKRWLARCAVGAADLGEWLASNGWVFAYRACKCETIRGAVERAKTQRLGIWSGDVQEPWEWRRAN